MAILLTVVGFLRSGMLTILEFLKSIFEWAKSNPTAAIMVALMIACGSLYYWGDKQRDAREVAEKSLKDQKDLNKSLSERLDQYVKALETEKDSHRKTIKDNNEAVQNLKDEADKAAKKAADAVKEAKKEKDRYLDLAEKYSDGQSVVGTAEERILREQKTNDLFFKEFKAGAK